MDIPTEFILRKLNDYLMDKNETSQYETYKYVRSVLSNLDPNLNENEKNYLCYIICHEVDSK